MSCRKHNSDMNVFCLTDQTVACVHCVTMEHRGHTLGLVSEERKMKQENLKNMLIKSKEIQQSLQKRCNINRRMIEQIQVEAKEAEDFCEGVLVQVIDSLQRHYRSVRRMIRAREEAAIAQVDLSIQRSRQRMERMKRQEAELGLLARTEGDVDFLQKWTGLQGHLEPDVDLVRDADEPGLDFGPIKRTLQGVGRQLEELCAKEFSLMLFRDDAEDDSEEQTDGEEDEQQIDSSGHEVVSGLTRQMELQAPETRADFLHYAHRLTFDSATAHQDLVVSADGREVRLCGQTVKGPSIRYPHRFVHRKQLLCREPLLAEWSYYEVEVEGSKAEIALAYSAMDRKSRSNQSAFGGNAQSWSLDRSAFYSVSHKALSVQLITVPCHSRIGVFVKVSEGVVAFYEVAETMILLYEMEAVFTEPLYPGFWLGEKCRISICDLV
ncbi:tripartite motif-containing protein 16-like [Synchiropus splendidus]|uniref:tripartite motif-containing protein 16-like n=1 Tax=Synchiropus splendidus TaxID=270530 RepID=UPI00237D3A2F|nr:tripartite motif-containing protein 16-like [Synchiropus splendidus]